MAQLTKTVAKMTTVVSRIILFQFSGFFFSMFSPGNMSRSWTYKTFLKVHG
jgi:hypothetical protein